MKIDSPISDAIGSDSDENGSNPDESGSESDNNTHYETVNKPLGNPFKRPQPPAAVSCENLPSASTNSEPTAETVPVQAKSERTELLDKLMVEADVRAEVYDDLSGATQDSIKMFVADIAQMFIQDLDINTLRSFIVISDNNLIISHVGNALIDYMAANYPELGELPALLNKFIRHLSFYVVVAAFINRKPRKRILPVITHPVRDIADISYSVQIWVGSRLDEADEIIRQGKIEQLKAQETSLDKANEKIGDATPAEKTRTFRNGLQERNAIGGDFWNGTRHPGGHITIPHNSLRGVEKLFTENPNCTPHILLEVMDGCVNLFMTEQEPFAGETDPKWHARRGLDLGFFVKNVPQICDQLGIHCPIG